MAAMPRGRSLLPPHLFTVHVQVLPVDLQLDDDDLVVPLLADGGVPDVPHVQRAVDATDDLQDRTTGVAAACPRSGASRPAPRGRPCLLTMLPPTDASASVSLGEKPAPQSCREKMLGTRVCFTSESKKGSRLSSGCGRKSRGRAGMCQCCPFSRGSPLTGALCSRGRVELRTRNLNPAATGCGICCQRQAEPGLTRAISAYASPRIPSQLEPLMKNLSDSVMAAMLALTVTLGPCGMVTRSVPSSPSHLPWV